MSARRGGPLLAFLLWMGCGSEPAPPEAEVAPERPAEAPAWPAEGAPLTVLEVQVPEGFAKRRVYIDAGHGAPSNTGAEGAYCQVEQEFTLRAADELARRLRDTGAFEVRVSRSADEQPTYPERIAAANEWADVMISLHYDARLAAKASTWSPEEGQTCRYNEGEHGFSVLYSDEGETALAARRRALAVELAEELTKAGFPPYLGDDYVGLYTLDPDRPGAWVDRHEPRRRIMMLRRPQVPSVIVETHQSLDREEVLRWQEERTFDAFGAAVAVALIDYFQQLDVQG